MDILWNAIKLSGTDGTEIREGTANQIHLENATNLSRAGPLETDTRGRNGGILTSPRTDPSVEEPDDVGALQARGVGNHPATTRKQRVTPRKGPSKGKAAGED